MKMETAKYDENRLLHLLLDMGEMLLASGAEINRVEDTLQRSRACIWRCQNERIRDHIEHCDHNGKNRRGTAYTHQKSELYGQYGFYCTGTAQCTQQELLYQPHSAGPVSAAGFRRSQSRGDDGIFIWEVSWQQAVLLCFLAGHLQMELWRHWWLS